MTFHALVVDDDDEIREDVSERLESLGHTFDCVGCQKTARDRIASGTEYSYILLDLELPLRYGKKPILQNGRNLLLHIRSTRGFEDIPVIVMTGHGLDGPGLAVEVMKDGANDYVTKPFLATGDTLEKRIAEALQKRMQPGVAKTSSIAPEATELRPFEAGELVFYEDRVELEGVKVCGNRNGARIRLILDELRQKNSRGRYVAYGGQQLAELIDCEYRGQNSISEAVKDFRNVVKQAMQELGVEVGQQDVIESGGPGYRLSKRITVIDADDPLNDPQTGSDDPQSDPDDPQNDSLNDRQAWIIQQLRSGTGLRIGDVVDQWGCSKTTAKRDLAELRDRGLIKFEGAARTGCWQLVT